MLDVAALLWLHVALHEDKKPALGLLHGHCMTLNRDALWPSLLPPPVETFIYNWLCFSPKELASKFGMPGLRQRCDAILSRGDLARQYLKADRVVQAAVFASLHNLPTMLAACQAYLVTHYSQVQPSLQHFAP